MNVTIRPYTDADFEAVTAIWLSSWQSTGIPAPVTLAELRERWPLELAKDWTVSVAAVEIEVAGFMAFHCAELEQLFIAPEHQSRGIGKQLLDYAKAQMLAGFHLTTAGESRAPRFYDREGLMRSEAAIHPKFGHEIVRYDWLP
jgi:putative acetyltransferase